MLNVMLNAVTFLDSFLIYAGTVAYNVYQGSISPSFVCFVKVSVYQANALGYFVCGSISISRVAIEPPALALIAVIFYHDDS